MPHVTAVSRSPKHTFSKVTMTSVCAQAGHGIVGDAHAGATVKHRHDIETQGADTPNLRQVHLIPEEIYEMLRGKGHEVTAGGMGENITTRNIPLMEQPFGTKLHIGPHAVIELTGLRTPCNQLNTYRDGLMKDVIEKQGRGMQPKFLAGVMGIVVTSGFIRPNDPIRIELPERRAPLPAI